MTPRQKDCLRAIRELTVDGISPTYDQIKEHMGLASKANVHRIVHSLKERGVLTVSPYRNRSLAIRNEHGESIPFDEMAGAVADLIAKGGRIYPSQVKAAMLEAYAGAAQ